MITQKDADNYIIQQAKEGKQSEPILEDLIIGRRKSTCVKNKRERINGY